MPSLYKMSTDDLIDRGKGEGGGGIPKKKRHS